MKRPDNQPKTESFIPKYRQVSATLRKRIQSGDYTFKNFPSERSLAAEMKVSFMTVRRSLRRLEQENLLVRQNNRRMTVKHARHGAKSSLNFGFLATTMNSGAIEFWLAALNRQAAKYPCHVRPVMYSGWDDPILMDALKGFDGVFVNPADDVIPPHILATFRSQQHPVVMFDEDHSACGVPSILCFIPSCVQKLFDHLEERGHRQIGCLNTQALGREINERINQWRYRMSATGKTGDLVNDPVIPPASAMKHAYEVMGRVLDGGAREETAWFCTTTAAAIGTMCAMFDRGIQPGRDVVVCAVNGEGLASLLNPPLTALEPADPDPYLDICLNWMVHGGKNWQGPLLMNPVDVPLVIRESTCPGAGRGVIK